MPWQFLVVDGADAKSVFPLPERGTVLIGRSHQDVDIFLNDLFVARVHCQIEVSGDGKLTAKHLYGAGGSFVNKEKIDLRELHEGDVLRVGNTHLRLDPARTAGPAPKSARSSPAQPADQPAAPGERLAHLQGQLLGHFEIGELLAHSPFRAVYLARDGKTGNTVVLKILAPQFPASPAELNHFIPVMRQALHLRHEHLVTLLGVGKNGPYTWIAREHVVGESLADVLQRLAVTGRTRPKWHRGLRLALEIGQTLDYVHGHHLLHGRLTPHNILINTSTKEAKLANLMLDQALAGSLLGRQMADARQPLDVAFLAPEQCEAGAFVDDLSDQYGLGAIVYARLTGRPPFLGDTVEETLELIRTAPLAHPRQLNPTIPDEFSAVVVRMLARLQEDRYPSPASLLAALEPFAAEVSQGANAE